MLHKASLPLPIYSKGRGDKKRTNTFSMSVYRNMHYQSLNKVKHAYHKEVEDWVKILPRFKSITPKYTLFFKGKRKKDIDNTIFPVHKFLMDAFVENGIIEDDNYDYVRGFAVSFGDCEQEEDYVIVTLIGEEDDCRKSRDV